MAGDPATQPADPVAAYKSEYIAFVRIRLLAQRAVIAAFDPVIKSAMESGNHDNVDIWEKARDDFMHTGKIPENSPEQLQKALNEYAKAKIPPQSLLDTSAAAIAELKKDIGNAGPLSTLRKQREDLLAATRPATTSPSK